MICEYRRKENFMMRRHPAAGVAVALALVSCSMIPADPFFPAVAIVSLALIAASAGVLSEWLSWWRICALIGAATAIINPLLSSQGSTILWRGPHIPVLGTLEISAEAVLFGLASGLRLTSVIWAFALATLTVNPDELLGSLRGRGSRSALVTALSLRLVPATARDTRELIDAQRARGLVPDSGSRLERVVDRAPLMKRILLTSLDRGIGIAEAMESRAYGSGPRTRQAAHPAQAGDLLTAVLAATVLAAVIMTSVSGAISVDYYPRFNLTMSGIGLLLLLVPLFASITIGAVSISWKRKRLSK